MEHRGREERRLTVGSTSVPDAVTPTEAARLNDAKDQAAFAAAVIKINEMLKRSYSTGDTVRINEDIVGSGKVGDKVVAHFMKAGWKVKRESVNDPRECFVYYEFGE